jgi:hypothetical protein
MFTQLLPSKMLRLYDVVAGSFRGDLIIPEEEPCRSKVRFKDMHVVFHPNKDKVFTYCHNQETNEVSLTLYIYNMTFLRGKDMLMLLKYPKRLKKFKLPAKLFIWAIDFILDTDVLLVISFRGGAFDFYNFRENNHYKSETVGWKFQADGAWPIISHYRLGEAMIFYRSILVMIQEFFCRRKGDAGAMPVRKQVRPLLRLTPPRYRPGFQHSVGMDKSGRIVFLDAVIKKWVKGEAEQVLQWVKIYKEL